MFPVDERSSFSMSNSTKKGFGVYATLVSAVLAIAAAGIYQVIGGKFGATQRVCYDQWVVLLRTGGGGVSGAKAAPRVSRAHTSSARLVLPAADTPPRMLTMPRGR